MAEEIQLFKADGQEWGFRVAGGADFGTPLAIIKINKGSVGERAGLKVGDMIVQVNDQQLNNLSHFQATNAINKAGNKCMVVVIRGSLVQPPQLILQNGQEEHESAIQENQEPQPPTEQEELVLPSVLSNLISSGLEEQEKKLDDEVAEATEPQIEQGQPEGEDLESFSGQLVVTIQCGTPRPSDKGQGEGWEIVDERSVVVENVKQCAKRVAQSSGQAVKSKKTVNTGTKKVLQKSEKFLGQQTQEQPQVLEQETKEPTGQQGNDEGVTEGQTTEGTEENHIEYTDDEIAEMMSGCAEVLVGKCIGVDFQKLPPDTDIMKSEVLQVLIDEKIHPPEKKLSTFQQRPARPKPKPKGEPVKPPEPYYPLKYKGQPKKAASPNPEVEPKAEENGDIACPDEETAAQPEGTEGVQPVEIEEHTEEQTDQEPVSSSENVDESEEVPLEQEAPEQTLEDPNDIEFQLSEIQSQLAAIIQLPVEIQQHLSFIQQQLCKILELRAAGSTENQEPQEEATTEEHERQGDAEGKDEENVEEREEQVAEGEEQVAGGEQEEVGEEEEQVVEELETEQEPESEAEPEPEEPKPKKDIQWKKEGPEKRRPFFPLTPQPRPVQLPGGRKWFQPRDIYTEDFIAETLSGKEEVITGTTIGVDFRKFECNYDHLKSSSVYKMIHSSENNRTPGIFADREEKAHAKEDYVAPTQTSEANFSLYKTRQIIK